LGGQLAAPDAPVRLTVSLGPLRQPVPDVSRLLGERAIRVLEATGFRVSVDSTDSELPLGTVIGVDPVPGTVLAIPGDVRVALSRGPALVAMPYLLGVAEEAAIDSLRVLGLGAAVDTVFRFGRDQGLVVEQLPPADSLLQRGSQVRLSVGRRGGG
jgi:serine/threonine-protein kinase